jgi:large subunit ribosomal protein L31
MKKDTHPQFNIIKASCACGNEFETGSTTDNIRVEICAACHPFYTGKQKLIDTAGRVERFQKKYAKVLNAKEKTADSGEKATNEGA